MRISYFELTLCLKLESAVTQSRTVPSSHDLFSAAFTTIIAESNFQYTQPYSNVLSQKFAQFRVASRRTPYG
jgi:hypothetical protein